MKILAMYHCKHCMQEINELDTVSSHPCFLEKSVYMDENNILFIIEENQSTSGPDNETSGTSCFIVPDIEDEAASKQYFVWDRSATLGLLSLYEANIDMMDHPKKKTKIWEAISNGLKKFGIQVTSDQVRWKMNALIKRYKEIVDNNSKSGRGVIEFQWFDQMDEIFGKQRNVAKRHTVTSKFPTTLPKSSASIEGASQLSELEKKRHSEPSELASTSKCDNIVLNNNDTNKKRRALHGTGSNTAKTKLELEKQWLQYLRNKEESDRTKDKKYACSNENKKETLKLKKRQLALKEEELKQRKEMSIKKAKEKQNRHAELMEIEKQKIKLLKKILKDDDTQNSYSSESN